MKHVMLLSSSLDGLLCDHVTCTKEDSGRGAGCEIRATEESRTADYLR